MNVYEKLNTRIDAAKAAKILSEFDPQDDTHTDQIILPKPGDLIIFWSNDIKKYRDYLADGYKWRNQGAKKPLPSLNPIVSKSYYHFIDKNGKRTNDFIKDVYTLYGSEDEIPVLVHYISNRIDFDDDVSELEFESGPHGNIQEKNQATNFQRTLPSVLTQLKEKVAKKAPNLVYKEQSKKKPSRDLKQCQNLRYAVNRLKRFTYDEIANCHLMHISLGFPNLIVTVPDIRIIGLDLELLNETKKTLRAFDSSNRVCFQYDTTFNLTGYYVSLLLFIHPILVISNTEKGPPVPIAYFFHEKKFEKTHDEFWRYIADVLPEINDKAFIITDCETGFRNSIKRHFPDTPLLRCWNHFYKSTERWILNNPKKMAKDDVGFYCDSVRELLLQPTKQIYESQLKKKINGYTNSSGQIIEPWKPEFVEYYNSHIATDIESLAAWSVRPICKYLFNHFTGITTNQSEGRR